MSTGEAFTLRFTGERMIPDLNADHLLYAEHLSRYYWARQFVQSMRVLDVGCGSGYGSALLAESGAASVVGIDVADDAIRYAKTRYRGNSNITFATGAAEKLPLATAAVDVVVCFELIEHVAAQDAVLDEITRVLRPGGLAVLSTPNAQVYLPGNEFHVREFARPDFDKLLISHFSNIAFYYQKNWVSSSVLSEAEMVQQSLSSPFDTPTLKVAGVMPGEANYFIALCSTGTRPKRNHAVHSAVQRRRSPASDDSRAT